jgi:DNA-binding NarL/FixJ family response regulator
VIAISGSDYQERALEMRAAGAVDYLRKSRAADEVVDAILALVASSQSIELQ